MLRTLFIDGFIKVLTTFVFITIHKLLLRDKLFLKLLILTGSTTISIVHFYSYSVISFYYCKFNIT